MRNPSGILASCTNCGAVFSSAYNGMFDGDVSGVSMRENFESCPSCGGMAKTADGLFNITRGVLEVVSAPGITRQMLASFDLAVKKAYEVKTMPEALAKEVEAIHPSFGDLIRKTSASKPGMYWGLLFVLATAIKSCNFEVKLDVNQLIDQMRTTPPSIIMKYDGPTA